MITTLFGPCNTQNFKDLTNNEILFHLKHQYGSGQTLLSHVIGRQMQVTELSMKFVQTCSQCLQKRVFTINYINDIILM